MTKNPLAITSMLLAVTLGWGWVAAATFAEDDPRKLADEREAIERRKVEVELQLKKLAAEVQRRRAELDEMRARVEAERAQQAEQNKRRDAELERKRALEQAEMNRLRADVERRKAAIAEQRARADAQRRLAEQQVLEAKRRAEIVRDKVVREEAEVRDKHADATAGKREKYLSWLEEISVTLKRKELDPKERRALEEKREELQADVEEMSELLKRRDREREPHQESNNDKLERHLKMAYDKMLFLARQGHVEEAEKLEREVDEIAGELRRRKDQHVHSFKRSDRENRLRHIQQAIEHLQAAGVDSVARSLRLRLRWEVEEHGDHEHEHEHDVHEHADHDHEHGEHGDHDHEHGSGEDRQEHDGEFEEGDLRRVLHDIHRQLDQLRHEMDDVKRTLREASRRR